MIPAIACNLLCVVLSGPAPADSSEAKPRIFPYTQADQARELARSECVPLVIHFVPDNQLGADQLRSYYQNARGVDADALAKVVVIVVPTRKFRAFARQLGITGEGGMRTISPYDLSAVDDSAELTCRSGFV